jgi:hypothetical protein
MNIKNFTLFIFILYIGNGFIYLYYYFDNLYLIIGKVIKKKDLFKLQTKKLNKIFS